MRVHVLPLCVPLLSACALDNVDTETVRRRTEAIVYGEDDRVDVYEAAEPFATLAQSAAVALLHPDRLRPNGDGTFSIDAPLLGETFSLCDGERFSDQPSAANCSGVLIGEDLVATSGHCVSSGTGSAEDCSQTRFVFGYHFSEGVEAIVIGADDVYECSRVVTRIASASDSECKWDLAVVRLDRPVQPPRAPARARATPVETGEALTVIGFPTGLPAKVDSGARVIDARVGRADYFTLNSDTFFVSSGSGVFDAAGQLVGLFSRGEPDFEQADACQRVRRVDDTSASGYEEATKIDAVFVALEASIGNQDIQTCESNQCELGACASSTSDGDSGKEPGTVDAAIAEADGAAWSSGCEAAGARSRAERRRNGWLSMLLLVAWAVALRRRHRTRGTGRSSRIARRSPPSSSALRGEAALRT